MKRLLILMILLMPICVNAYEINDSELTNASYINCSSKTDIWLKIEDEYTRVKLVGMKFESGKLDDEIDSYICKSLKNAKKIEVLIAPDEKDEYNRKPVWLFIDKKLLQENLVEKGYSQVGNLINSYKLVDELCKVQKEKLINKVGIWSYSDITESLCNSGIDIDNEDVKEEKEVIKEETNEEDYDHMVVLMVIILILLIIMLISRKREKYGKRQKR